MENKISYIEHLVTRCNNIFKSILIRAHIFLLIDILLLLGFCYIISSEPKHLFLHTVLNCLSLILLVTSIVLNVLIYDSISNCYELDDIKMEMKKVFEESKNIVKSKDLDEIVCESIYNDISNINIIITKVRGYLNVIEWFTCAVLCLILLSIF